MLSKSKKIHKIQLTEEKETLLITLYAKALDNRSKKPILNDKKAEEILDMIDYDFEKLDSFGDGNIMVVRAKQIDSWLQEFLDINPDAIILNLGCGLDTRISRINPPTTANWFDLDFPEVIELRKQFYSNREGYEMIASSVTEPEWLEYIPGDRPVMVITEGLLEYLSEDEVKILFNRLSSHFSHGQIAFDVMNSFAITSGKESLKETTGAEHKWAVDDINEVDKLNNDFKRITSMSIFKSNTRKLPLKYRLIYSFMSIIPAFKNMIRLLLYRF